MRSAVRPRASLTIESTAVPARLPVPESRRSTKPLIGTPLTNVAPKITPGWVEPLRHNVLVPGQKCAVAEVASPNRKRSPVCGGASRSTRKALRRAVSRRLKSMKSSTPSKRAAGYPFWTSGTSNGANAPCGWRRSFPRPDWSRQMSMRPPLGGNPASARTHSSRALSLAGENSPVSTKPATVVALGSRSARKALALTVVLAVSSNAPSYKVAPGVGSLPSRV
jgi:hypothetical protein